MRSKYLVPCSLKRDRSILDKSKKQEFIWELSELRTIAEKKIKQLHEQIQLAIFESEDKVRQELAVFFRDNPPDELNRYSDLATREKVLKRMIEDVLRSMKFPSADELLGKIKIWDDYACMSSNESVLVAR